MGRGSLVNLHRQLLFRFDNVTQSGAVGTLGSEQLKRLDDCSSLFRAWSEQIGVPNGALDELDDSGDGHRTAISNSLDGIYIRLRVVGKLMKEIETAGTEREEEPRPAAVHTTKSMESLKEQVEDIHSFLERLSEHGSATEFDSDDSQVRHASNSTEITGTASNWTTTTCSTDDEAVSSPITPKPPRAFKASKTPRSPHINKTPRAQLNPGPVRKSIRVVPASGTAASSKTYDVGWEEEWDRELVLTALSAPDLQANAPAVGDKDTDANAKQDVEANGEHSEGSDAPKTEEPVTTSSPSADDATHIHHPVNTTWIEDNSSNYKEETAEAPKAQMQEATPPATAKSSPSTQQSVDQEREYELFRKHVSSRMRLLEKLNRSLARKIEELESSATAHEYYERDFAEQAMRKKRDEEAREKLIKEAAIEEYKERLRFDKEREQERRKILMREATLIKERAQREMTEIYQQSGLQIHEAAKRHQDEAFQVQQRLTEELLTIERKFQEQIQEKMWNLTTRPADDHIDKGKGRRVSFEPREQPSSKQPDGQVAAEGKNITLQVPSYRASAGLTTATRPDTSRSEGEQPPPTSYAKEHPSLNPAERNDSTEYRPIAAVAPWEIREFASHDHQEPPEANTKRMSTTASRFRRLARALRLKPVDRSDINVVKVSKGTNAFPIRAEGAANQRISKGSFFTRRRRASSINQAQPEQRFSAYEDAHSTLEQPALAQPMARPSYQPEHQLALVPQRTVSGSSGFAYQTPSFQPFQNPSRYAPMSFHPGIPPGTGGSSWPRPTSPPHPGTATKAHKNHATAPEPLTYHGHPWEWDRVSPLVAAAAYAAREQEQQLKRQRRRYQVLHRSSRHSPSSSTFSSPSSSTSASQADDNKPGDKKSRDGRSHSKSADLNTPTPASRQHKPSGSHSHSHSHSYSHGHGRSHSHGHGRNDSHSHSRHESHGHGNGRKHKHKYHSPAPPAPPSISNYSSPFTPGSSSNRSTGGAGAGRIASSSAGSSSNSNHADKYWPALTHLSSLPMRTPYY